MTVLKVTTNYFKRHILKLLLIIIIIVLVTILSLIPAQVLRKTVDDIIPSKNYQKLLLISIVFCLSYLLIGVVTFIKDIIMLGTSLSITKELRLIMMKHVEKIKYNELVKRDSGTLESYFNNDVNAINELFTSGVVNMITDSFKVIGIVISIFIYSIRFGFIVLMVLPFLVAFTAFVRKRMLKAQLKTKTLESGVNKLLLENVSNIEQIKINKATTYASSKYEQVLKSHFKANQSSNFYDALFSPVMQIIRSTVICAIILISGYNANIFGMTIGMIISAISLITDLFTPIENLGMEIQTIQKSSAAVKRINEFFQIEERTETLNQELDGFQIEFNNVTFAYDKEEVINNFNLIIKEKDKIALQGPSGSGKSTIMKLALGLIKPTKGSVKINGIDNFLLSDTTRKKDFAIVYQDPFFSGLSIYDEITLLDSTISRDTVRNALNIVGLDYISNLDEILKPSSYSSGELQLFNIARVIVKQPKVIFLDEMNAKIDPVTSEKILSIINDISRDKTVISINHYGNILNNAKVIKLS